MKAPIKVSTSREHTNAGNVILTLTGADGEAKSFAVPGEVSAFTAMRMAEPFLIEALNPEARVGPHRYEPQAHSPKPVKP